MQAKIIGTGSYIPENITPNKGFIKNKFLNREGSSYPHDNEVIINKFKAITGISERRYIEEDQVCSDIALLAAQKALKNAGCTGNSLDYIICAHNYGDIKHGDSQSDMVPSLATRVKYGLNIENPGCVAYDVLFGCPGWILGMTQAQAFIKAGMAQRILIVGAETLSRVVDSHDRDSMIYSDGAGAVVVEKNTDDQRGILAQANATYTSEEAFFIFNGKSFDKKTSDSRHYIKMYGRRIYNFALKEVPKAMKKCLDESGYQIEDLKKIFIHQANEKMDEAILKRFYELYDREVPQDIMPMNIHLLGNSSVATVPTLYDMVRREEIEGHKINEGDLLLFASVGAGMNINAIAYRA